MDNAIPTLTPEDVEKIGNRLAGLSLTMCSIYELCVDITEYVDVKSDAPEMLWAAQELAKSVACDLEKCAEKMLPIGLGHCESKFSI